MGIVSYQHTCNSQIVGDFRAMFRNNANDFNSNDLSTPIEVFQHNYFNEAYFKGALTVVHGRHEFKFGLESDNTFLNENFRYLITDPTQFDPDTPLTFGFIANRPDLEQSAFVQDRMSLGNWTINAGLRYDYESPITELHNFLNAGFSTTAAEARAPGADSAYSKRPAAAWP